MAILGNVKFYIKAVQARGIISASGFYKKMLGYALGKAQNPLTDGN
jgi:hypothetical protein